MPPRPDGVQDEPMNAEETSRKRSAEDAGHEANDAGRGGAQPDPGSMALAEACPPASPQQAGALRLSAGVAMDLRLGWDLGKRADQVEAEKRLNDEKPHLLIFESHVLGSLSLSRLQHAKPDESAELLEQGKRHLEFACSLAEFQIEQDGRVLIQYPCCACGSPGRSMACAVFDPISASSE